MERFGKAEIRLCPRCRNKVSRSDGFFCYGLSLEQIVKEVKEFDADAVGITVAYSSQFEVVSELCSKIKLLSKDITTVIGGTHPTFLAKQCLEYNRDIDFILLGEGERSFPELIEKLNNDAGLDDIDGLGFRRGYETVVNPQQKLIMDVDSIPFPARDMLDLEKYKKIRFPMGLVWKQSPIINMITSRGCPCACSFCSSCNFWGLKFRPRSVENVLEEMQVLKDMGYRELKFFDDNLTLDSKRAKEIFKGMIDRKFNFTWSTPNGVAVQTLDEEMIRLMKQSGCFELALAIESGDKYILKNVVRKPIDLDKALDTAEIIRKYGINTLGFFMIGFPGETKQQVLNTLDYMKKLKTDRVSLFIVNPLPGTWIYECCKEKGLFDDGKLSVMTLDYFHSPVNLSEVASDELETIRRNTFFLYNISLFFRSPLKFFRIWHKFIFMRPLLLIKMLIGKMIKPIIFK